MPAGRCLPPSPLTATLAQSGKGFSDGAFIPQGACRSSGVQRCLGSHVCPTIPVPRCPWCCSPAAHIHWTCQQSTMLFTPCSKPVSFLLSPIFNSSDVAHLLMSGFNISLPRTDFC